MPAKTQKATKPYPTKEVELVNAKASEGDSPGTFEGYASTFGNWDSVKEKPVKGAFLRWIEDFIKDGFIAEGHDWSSMGIGTIREAYEDDFGLYIKVDFHSDKNSQEIRQKMQERIERGKTVKLSIGYKVKDSEQTEEGRLLKEIQLFEVSVVTVPANPLATVMGVKSESEQSEEALREPNAEESETEPETPPTPPKQEGVSNASIKAALLGDSVEADMTMSALDTLHWRLYNTVWSLLLSDKSSDEIISTASAYFDEYKKLALSTITAIMQSKSDDKYNQLKEFKALIDNKGSVELLPDGMTTEQHSEAALAAVKGFVDRVKEITALRAKEGRAVSATNRERINKHKDTTRQAASTLLEVADDLEKLLADTDPNKPEIIKGLCDQYLNTMSKIRSLCNED